MVQNIVIVGGGGAGVATAVALVPKLDPAKHQLVLISERSFHTHMPAAIRVNVSDDGKLEDKLFLSLEKLFKSGKPGQFINARVERADANSVYLDNGKSVPYAALILATGNTWRGMLDFPRSFDETLDSVRSWRARFAKARSVLIIGGGAVGMELAGEVKEYFPKTEVTLLHGDKHLLNGAYPDAFRSKLDAQFKKAGVKLILDDVALDLPRDMLEEIQGPVQTKKGKSLNADLILVMTGGRPNSSVAESLDASVIAPDGRVKILPTFQVPLSSGKRNVFAVGDIIDWPEQHTLVKAAGHAAVVVPNVLAVLSGQEAKKSYKTPPEMILITRGKSGGLGFANMLWGITMGPWVVKSMKGKTLFTEMAAKSFA